MIVIVYEGVGDFEDLHKVFLLSREIVKLPLTSEKVIFSSRASEVVFCKVDTLLMLLLDNGAMLLYEHSGRPLKVVLANMSNSSYLQNISLIEGCEFSGKIDTSLSPREILISNAS